MLSFCDVYNQNLVIKNDPSLANLSPPDYFLFSWRLLRFAISYFYADDTIDYAETIPRVGQYIPYQRSDSFYYGDGGTTAFPLAKERLENSLLYVTVSEGECVKTSVDYEYDAIKNSIVFRVAPSAGSEVNIVNYVIGGFVSETPLCDAEITILSEGMNIPYFEQRQGTRNILDMAVYSGTFREHSRGEHLYRISEVVKAQREYVDMLIMEYSYKYNTENYTGLRGNV